MESNNIIGIRIVNRNDGTPEMIITAESEEGIKFLERLEGHLDRARIWGVTMGRAGVAPQVCGIKRENERITELRIPMGLGGFNIALGPEYDLQEEG